MNKKLSILHTVMAAVAFLLLGTVAHAQDLRMAVVTEWNSLDPQFHNNPANFQIDEHLYDPLVRASADGKLVPALATSWKAIDDKTWEFKLRTGVKFHNGAEFTADDVKYTIERIPTVPNSPAQLTLYTASIANITIVDPHTIRFTTKEANPLLPAYLAQVYIISKSVAGSATTADFNTGKATFGTGPYRFVEWQRGDRLVLKRNDGYWGGKPTWANVTIKPIGSAAVREATLLAGDVDLIQSVSSNSIAKLKKSSKIAIYRAPTTRITYLHMGQKEEQYPDVSGTNGKNPLADKRVRKAISMTIPRAEIAKRVMDGLSVPAGQVIPTGYAGHNPKITVHPADPKAAKKLLAEAGYPNGFEIALTTANDRNINGVAVAQVIAAKLRQIGIKVNIHAIPFSVFLPQWRAQKLPLFLHGIGPLADPSLHEDALTATRDMKAGEGVSNQSGYSNPELDKLFKTAERTLDTKQRAELLEKAAVIIDHDTAVIPVHWEVATWASRADIDFKPRQDGRTYAMSAVPKSK